METREASANAHDTRMTLVAGLHWLFDTEQPEGAVQPHHGVVLPAVDNRQFGFIPAGWSRRAIVTVDVAKVRYDGDGMPTNPLRPDELHDLTEQLATLGADVVETWNGHPSITGSLALSRPAHPTLLAAVALYRAGCPTHPRVGVFCDCGWFAAGDALVARPSVPSSLATAEVSE